MMTVEAASTTPDPTAKREEGAPVDDNPQVVNLVIDARKGNQQAWNALVELHSPLVWSICRRYRLSQADTEDVSQTVWMRLVHQLDGLQNPAALCGWLSTTTRRECSRVWRANCRHLVTEQGYNLEDVSDHLTDTVDHELLMAERNAALREAFTRLPPGCQRLLALLMADPPVPYAEISSRLGMSVGTIGPARRRCLDRLRRDPAVAGLLDLEARNASSNLSLRRLCLCGSGDAHGCFWADLGHQTMSEYNEPKKNQRITHSDHKPEHPEIETAGGTGSQADATDYEWIGATTITNGRFRGENQSMKARSSPWLSTGQDRRRRNGNLPARLGIKEM
jgi:RNA polymerase sigma factor (sigma-70 family)